MSEWFDALQWIHILLILTILLLLGGYIYLLLKNTQLETVRRIVGKWKTRVFGILFGLIVVIYLLYNLHDIQPNGWVEISLMTCLVAVTSVYALHTARQVETSMRMAEEMKNTRYDSVRPVIDIQLGGTPTDRIESALSAESGDFPGGLSCKLHNIGLGPAIDIYSYIQFQNKSLRNDFGTLAVEARTKKDKRLTVFQEGGRLVLKVFYMDIYGRCFKGSREVQIGKVTSSAESGLGPLKSILVERCKNDSGSNIETD